MTTQSTPLTAVEQLTVIELCLRNDHLTSAADACAAGLAYIARLERSHAELVKKMKLIVTYAEDDHDGFTYQELADLARAAIAEAGKVGK